jgi:myo-inositol 2-dehydrogenase / D-chiro-inositol 1-dehydrogenase
MTTPSRLTAGIIGAGWIGRQHAEGLARREDVVVGAVCDVDTARASALGESFGAEVFADWQEMLDAGGLDMLWVCTPPRSHRAPAVAAFELGIPVYLEKPVARTLEDARAIAGAARERRAICAIGYQWHSLEMLDELRAYLEGQSIGYLLGVSIGSTTSRPWFLDRAAGGGNLLERGSHHIDLVRTVAGEARSVQAAASKVSLSKQASDIDDAVTLTIEHESGALATLALAWTADELPSTYSLDVVATEGWYRLDLDPAFRLSGRGRGIEVEFSSTEHPFARSVTRFLEAVRLGDPARVFCTPEDATRTLAVAVAAEQALESGQTVPVGTS